jgi:hypothetical protein
MRYWTRRELALMGATAALSSLGFRRPKNSLPLLRPTGLLADKNALDRAVLAHSIAYETLGDRASRQRLLGAYASLAALRLDLDSGKVSKKDATARVTQILEAGKEIDPATFEAAANAFGKGSSPDSTWSRAGC